MLVVHLRGVAVDVAVEGLQPVVDHLHGPAGVQGQHAAVDLHGEVLAAAEGAAHAGHGEADLLQREAEGVGRLPLVDVEPLGGEEEVDAAVLVGDRQTGLRPQERLVLHAHGVHVGDHDLRLGLRVALDDRLVADDVALRVQLREGVVVRGPLGVGDRLQDLVLHDDLGQRPARGLGVVGGDQGHGLTLVADDVLGEDRGVGDLQAVDVLARHVLVGQDRVHTGLLQRLRDVQGADPGVGMGAAQGGAPEHVLGPQVGGVGVLPGDLQSAVRAQRAVPDPPVTASSSRWEVRAGEVGWDIGRSPSW